MIPPQFCERLMETQDQTQISIVCLHAAPRIAPVLERTRPSARGRPKKPNIVMLMTDDTGWGDFGCYLAGPRPSAIRPRTSTASPRKARYSPTGMASRAAPRAAPRSLPDGFRSARLSRSWSLLATKRPKEGNADDRRILQEEWLHDLLLGQVASWATSPSSTRSSTASTR